MLQLLALGAASIVGTTRRPTIAHAAPIIPRRVVFFYSEQGTLKQFNDDGSLKPFWAPTVPNAPDPFSIQDPWSTSAFTLGDMHGPLEAIRDKLLFLDGIDMISSNVDPIGAANAHLGGETHALVADNRQSPSLAGGISIDQFIAQQINSPSPVTALPSLELTINALLQDGGGFETAPLYAAAGQPIPIPGRPSAVYNRLFPNGPTPPEDNAEAEKRAAQQRSVVNFAGNEFSSLAGRMGKLDRDRLTAHADALRDLEERLALGVSATCVEPEPTITDGESWDGDKAAYDTNADIMMRLTQVALSCDLTRVATVHVGVPPNDAFGYYPVNGTTDFHDMVHQTCGVNPALGDNPEAIAIVKACHTYHSAMFAKFIELLDAIPESDGTTLLDNTLVVWCGQLAGGDHSLDRIPYILAGGMSGAVTPGRYVRYPRVASDNWPVYSEGPAHNDLFVALANMMGIEIASFGNPDVCRGALAGLA
jgi:Protein of unknown function (DUF1552)